MVSSRVPTIVQWGQSPFAARRVSSKRIVYYPDGMQLKMTIPIANGGEVEIVEDIRVTNSRVEYRFTRTSSGQTSTWSTNRFSAFQQLSLKPKQRTVIYGASSEFIQDQIIQRFGDDVVHQGIRQVKASKKSVTWGDEKLSAAVSAYGGWGLVKIKEIPNKEELKRLEAERRLEELDGLDFLDELEYDLEVASDEEDVENHEYPVPLIDFSTYPIQPFTVGEEKEPMNVDKDEQSFLAQYDLGSLALQENPNVDVLSRTRLNDSSVDGLDQQSKRIKLTAIENDGVQFDEVLNEPVF